MNFRHLFPPTVLMSAAFASLPISTSQAQAARSTRATATPVTATPLKVSPTPNADTTTSVATVPVGFTTVAVTPAANSSTPSSQVLSVPFYQSAAYAAAVTSVDSATQFTSSSASWTANQYAQTNAPYLVHFKSGASVGRYFLIQSNTANQVTVYPRGYNLSSVAAAADTFEIVPAYTLGTLFGTSSVPFLTSGSPNTADNLFLWNGTKFDQYFHDGNSWQRSDSLLSQNDTVLYPDEGIFLTRRGTTALNLTFVGTVPSTAEKSDLVGPGSTLVSNRFPVDLTLGTVGFQALPNWINSSSPNTADLVYLWGGTTWQQYFYDGSHWMRSDSLLTFDAQSITAGTAMFVIRRSTATGTTATLTQSLPYSL